MTLEDFMNELNKELLGEPYKDNYAWKLLKEYQREGHYPSDDGSIYDVEEEIKTIEVNHKNKTITFK